MESSGRGRGERPREFDRDLSVDLDFDPFPPRQRGAAARSDASSETAERSPEATGRDSGSGGEPASRSRRERSRRGRRLPRLGRARPEGDGPRRRRSETIARIGWAVPWIVFAVAIVVVGGPVFAVAMVGLACLCLVELFRMAHRFRPFPYVAFAAAAGMVAAAYYGDQFQILIAVAAAFPLILVFAALRGSVKGVTAGISMTVLGIVWIGIPFSYAVLLRELPLHGGALLVDVLVATFAADTAAYAGGRLFGRHRLAPAISPNKTVEGLAFSLVGGTLGFWFAGLYQDWLPGVDALAMGLCIAAIAPLGDLFESAIKRDLGVKDSGRALGPHGGLLDRVDAALFTIVAGYYLAIAFVY